jgi:hypothetical protein
MVSRPCTKCGATNYKSSKWRNGVIFACDQCSDMTIKHEAWKNTDLGKLLKEWYEYWLTSDEMPAKMPDSLHTRTAVALVENGYILPPA